jgi:hypothetical protein
MLNWPGSSRLVDRPRAEHDKIINFAARTQNVPRFRGRTKSWNPSLPATESSANPYFYKLWRGSQPCRLMTSAITVPPPFTASPTRRMSLNFPLPWHLVPPASGTARKIVQSSRISRTVRAGSLKRSCQGWIDRGALSTTTESDRKPRTLTGLVSTQAQNTSGMSLNG